MEVYVRIHLIYDRTVYFDKFLFKSHGDKFNQTEKIKQLDKRKNTFKRKRLEYIENKPNKRGFQCDSCKENYYGKECNKFFYIDKLLKHSNGRYIPYSDTK